MKKKKKKSQICFQ